MGYATHSTGMFRLLLFLAIATVYGQAPSNLTEDKSMNYLLNFGYLDTFTTDPDVVTASLIRLQHFANLPMTGDLDNATLTQMKIDRCGLKDPKIAVPVNARAKRYVLEGTIWQKNKLTWLLEGRGRTMDRGQIRLVLYKAFKLWSDVTNMDFEEIPANGEEPDIRVKFSTYHHLDPYPFDGLGGTLAHAFYPFNNIGLSGDVHFDDAEYYTYKSSQGRNLLWVATHEIGHSLGMEHSNVNEAVMYPWYSKYKPGFTLNQDDVLGIQALYGVRTQTTKSPSSPTTTTTTPTTATTTPTTTTTNPTTATTTPTTTTTNPTTTTTTPTTTTTTPTTPTTTTTTTTTSPTTTTTTPTTTTTTPTTTTTTPTTTTTSPTTTTTTPITTTTSPTTTTTTPIITTTIPTTTTTTPTTTTTTPTTTTTTPTTTTTTPTTTTTTPTTTTTTPTPTTTAPTTMVNPTTTMTKPTSYVTTKESQIIEKDPSQEILCPIGVISAVYYESYYKKVVLLTTKNKLYYANTEGKIWYGPIKTTNFLPRSRIRYIVDSAYNRINPETNTQETIYFAASDYFIYRSFGYKSGPHNIYGQTKNPLNLNFPSHLKQILSAMTWEEDGETYFFTKDGYWRYDRQNKKLADGYPKKISEGWPGAPNYIDSAYSTKDYSFFLVNEYLYPINRNGAVGTPEHIGERWLHCGGHSLPGVNLTDDVP